MMWYGDGGAGWFWMAAMMLLFWGGLIVLAVWAIRSYLHPSSPPGDPALDVLRKRLAAGEITAEEFEKTRKALQA